MNNKLAKYLPEIVYGGNDGIVTTFAVVSGFIGAGTESEIVGSMAVVLLFGLANLFADATSMGLGDFLSERSEHEATAKKMEEIDLKIAEHDAEIIEITRKGLISRGASEQEATQTLSMFKNSHKLWHDYLLNVEYNLESIDDKNPAINAFMTFFSFLVFGFIPLSPFIFLGENAISQEFIGGLSIFSTFIALLLLGILRWQLAGRNPLRNIFEILIIGGVASSIAFGVGLLFR